MNIFDILMLAKTSLFNFTLCTFTQWLNVYSVNYNVESNLHYSIRSNFHEYLFLYFCFLNSFVKTMYSEVNLQGSE